MAGIAKLCDQNSGKCSQLHLKKLIWNKKSNFICNSAIIFESFIYYVSKNIKCFESKHWNQAKILCPKLVGKSSLLHDLFIAVEARNESN